MAEEAQEEAQAAPAGGKKKIIIIGIVAAVLVIGALLQLDGARLAPEPVEPLAQSEPIESRKAAPVVEPTGRVTVQLGSTPGEIDRAIFLCTKGGGSALRPSVRAAACSSMASILLCGSS